MLKASITWLVMFGVSMILARGAAWQTAFQLTIPFPSYDENLIYGKIKDRVFSRAWLLIAIVSSSLVAAAMMVDEVTMLVLSGAGVILIVSFTAVQGYRLFRTALKEMNLSWPPNVSTQT